ncbi:hypothetical protein D9758_012997 [Tetrapyrgos nigripes]|uniref:DUF803-domain-containing protein n=1 Tax=Tetrapyrgos nigripes TaxID=182062 RepID=A0A8H5CBU0_9AGAR|nr:hypothetical protein D9758_012997 [Tetrapyrgos nigripes]
MRLLNTSTYVLQEFNGPSIPIYAILSHTWDDEEVLFSDLRHSWSRDAATRKKGWQKILGTCKRARDDDLKWVWIDTCCINKESSAELSEAINSMFRYYRGAFVCYAYLADYSVRRDGYPDMGQGQGVRAGNAAFRRCRWFTRGWTLQELLAPANLVFFDAEWKDMGTKIGLKEAVSRVTRIPLDVLLHGDLRNISIAAKMSWAAERETTREEDRAYSLMGIFGVNIPPLYGEGGPRAFVRLQEEIIKYSNDQSIFAWSATFDDDNPWDPRLTHRGLLARSPSEFKASGDIRVSLFRNKLPYSLTNQGLHIHLPMELVPDFPGQPLYDLYIAYLNCEVQSSNERLGIFLLKVPNSEDNYERWHPDWLLVLSGSPFHHNGVDMKEIYVEEFPDSGAAAYPGLYSKRSASYPKSFSGGGRSSNAKHIVLYSSKTESIGPGDIQQLQTQQNTDGSSTYPSRIGSPALGRKYSGTEYQVDYRPSSSEDPVKVKFILIRDSLGRVSLSTQHRRESLSPWSSPDLRLHRPPPSRRSTSEDSFSPPRDQVIVPVNETESLLITARRQVQHMRLEDVEPDSDIASCCRLEFESIPVHWGQMVQTPESESEYSFSSLDCSSGDERIIRSASRLSFRSTDIPIPKKESSLSIELGSHEGSISLLSAHIPEAALFRPKWKPEAILGGSSSKHCEVVIPANINWSLAHLGSRTRTTLFPPIFPPFPSFMSSSSSSSPTSTSSAAATSSSAAGGLSAGGGNLKVVGIILAIVSGLLIGSSFVFKKKGLLRAQAGHAAGEGVAYLKSPLWWTGMIMMILGELCNFAAYAFVEAIVVTPLGALSVVICAILSSFFLNETLTFFGWLGCGLCIIGSVIIALNGPSEQSVGQIREFQKLFLAPGFLAYASVLIAAALVIIFYFGPRYGKKSMLWWIMVCSMIGGISVSVTTGLGAAIVTTAQGENQFKYWFIYFLIVFVVVTLLTEVYYLNVALALFNTAMVTPTYYVIFTFFSILTTIVLFQGLKSTPSAIITLVMGFLVICFGITILQMSKVDPNELGTMAKLDRRSTLLLQAARSKTESQYQTDEEKSVLGYEDPGMDALRGSLHGTVGSIMRARRISQSSRAGTIRSRHGSHPFSSGFAPGSMSPGRRRDVDLSPGPGGLKRHQLYDAPMPSPAFTTTTVATRGDDGSSVRSPSFTSTTSGGAGAQLGTKKPTIKFGSQDVIHSYHPTTGLGGPDLEATHESRPTITRSPSGGAGLGTPGAVMHGGGYPPARLDTMGTGDNKTMSQLLTLAESPVEERAGSGEGLPRGNALMLQESEPHFASGSSSRSKPGHVNLDDDLDREVKSAPPVQKGFPRIPMPGGRKDSRDVFLPDSNSTTTLMTFPSVTDSARSLDDGDLPDEIGRSSGGGKSQHHSHLHLNIGEDSKTGHNHHSHNAKKYPRGAQDQDREETRRLFKKNADGQESTDSEAGGNSPVSGSTEDSYQLMQMGGIRLVHQTPGGHIP